MNDNEIMNDNRLQILFIPKICNTKKNFRLVQKFSLFSLKIHITNFPGL